MSEQKVGDVLLLELEDGRRMYCRVTEVDGDEFTAIVTDKRGHSWLDDWVREAAELGLYESTADPKPTR